MDPLCSPGTEEGKRPVFPEPFYWSTTLAKLSSGTRPM